MVAKLLVPVTEKIGVFDPEQLFFIRYWENGPHFRLRIKIGVDGSAGKIRRMIHDSCREVNEEMGVGAMPDSRTIVRVEEQAYMPETQRYGGEEGLLVAEAHFEASSLFVFSIAKEYDLSQYPFVMSIALQSQLVFVRYCGLSSNGILDLLKNIMNSWLPYAIKALVKSGQIVEKADLQMMRADCMAYFDMSFVKSGATIMVFLQSLFDELAAVSLAEAHPLFRWQSANKIILSQLNALVVQRKLNGPGENVKYNHRSVLSSLIHMTNNRLGVNNSDESYIAYMLIRFFDALKQAPLPST